MAFPESEAHFLQRRREMGSPGKFATVDYEDASTLDTDSRTAGGRAEEE